MRFLVDAALSPLLADGLRAAGHDPVHVQDRSLQSAADDAVLEQAASDGRALVSADTDFATLLASRRARRPSLILFRRTSQRRPGDQVCLLLANLSSLVESLENGSVVVIEDERIRVRALPFAERSQGN